MKLLSYNVGLVNPEAALLNVDALADNLLRVDADVVALHEFEPVLCDALDKAMREQYCWVYYLTRQDNGYSCALFSRWQMEDVCELWLAEGFEDMPHESDEAFLRKMAVTDEEREEAGKRGVIGATIVDADGKRWRVMTCHMMSNGFNQLLIYDGLSPWKRFPLFWERFQMSCKGRDTEAKYLRRWVEMAHKEGLPVVVCGDTNSFWWSKTIRILKKGDGGFNGGLDLNDAFESASCCNFVGVLKRWLSVLGYGHTLYAHNVMYFRLDYVLHSASVNVKSYKVPHWKHSDHYPVVVEIETE